MRHLRVSTALGVARNHAGHIRRTVCIGMLAGVFGLTAAAGLLHGQASSSSDEDAVRQVEDQIEAATGRNDADTLSRLWAPDYMFVNPAGQLLTGARRLQMFRSGELKVESYKRDQETIRIYGSTAIVIYRSTVDGTRSGVAIATRRLVTTVLVKRSAGWQAVSQQSTPIL